MSSYAAFQETYFDEYLDISLKLGDAICCDNGILIDNLVEKYFGTPETAVLLEGPIAYQPAEKGGGPDGSLENPAFLAVKLSKRDALRAIIKATENPDAQDCCNEKQPTLLMKAANHGDVETAKLLLSLNADPNKTICAGHFVLSALSYALMGKFEKTAEMLITSGARFTFYDALITTEVQEQFSPFIEELIRKNISLLSENGGEFNKTLLHTACRYGNSHIVEWLLNNGADINATDSENRTPLEYAIGTNNDKIAKYLVSQGGTLAGNDAHSPSSPTVNTESAPSKREMIDSSLRQANNANEVLTLAETEQKRVHSEDHMERFQKIYPNYPNHWQLISIKLGNAICEDDYLKIEPLIDEYFSTPETSALLVGPIAYQSAENGGGEAGQIHTPVWLALNHSDFALGLIIKAIGNPNLTVHPRMEETPLIYAVWLGDFVKVHLLLELGANPNKREKGESQFSDSPLSSAIAQGRQDIVETLIANGAIFTVEDAFRIVESGNEFSPFNHELMLSNLAILQEHGGPDNRTLLHHACGHGKTAIVEWLIDHGADLDALDGDDKTPLFYADLGHHETVADYLIAKGADPSKGQRGMKDDLQRQLKEAEGQLEIAKAEEKRIREEAVPVNVTGSIERLELIEDKLGVRFDGIYGVQVKRGWENPVDFLVEVTFDVVGTEDPLKKSFKPTLSAYNAAGQLVNTCTTFIHNANFLGIESCKLQLLCREEPARLRLYPANPM